MFYILLYVLYLSSQLLLFPFEFSLFFSTNPFFSTTISFSIQLPSPFNYPLLLHSNTLSFSIQLPSPSPFNFPLLLLSTILSFSFQLSSPSPFNYPLLLSTTPFSIELPLFFSSSTVFFLNPSFSFQLPLWPSSFNFPLFNFPSLPLPSPHPTPSLNGTV